jgi:ABC-type transporter Mla maintaining outer membrane lipid asymmetry ATPase subunit MlaF
MDLHADRLILQRGGRSALDGVSLALPMGTRVLVLGVAQSGKTALLKALAGLARPSGGTVRWDGEDAQAFSAEERRARQARVGFVFQSDALFDSSPVLENVRLPLLRRRVPGPEATARARSALEAVGLGAAERALPEQLSGGMRKRAGLARALVTQPEVILADDPLAGLDPATAVGVADLLARSSENRTLVVAASDPPEALELPRWIVLSAGRVLYDGPPAMARWEQAAEEASGA